MDVVCQLPKESVKVFAKGVAFLSKVADEVHFEFCRRRVCDWMKCPMWEFLVVCEWNMVVC
jgi:hypothetical protein